MIIASKLLSLLINSQTSIFRRNTIQIRTPCSLLPLYSIQSSCSRDRIPEAGSTGVENPIVSIEKHITVDILGPASDALQ